MRHSERLGNRTDLLVGIENLGSFRIIRRNTGSELTAVLDVQKHRGDKRRHVLVRHLTTYAPALTYRSIHPVQRCYTTLVMNIFTHWGFREPKGLLPDQRTLE